MLKQLLAVTALLLCVSAAMAAEQASYNCNDNVNDQWNASTNDSWVGSILYNTSYPTYGTSGSGSTKSCDLNGSNYWYSNSITPKTTSSVAYWINLKAAVAADGTYPVNMGADSGKIWNSASIYINRSMYLAYNGGSWSNDYTGYYLPLGSWTHVITVISPTTKRMYINGSKVYEKNYTTNTPVVTAIHNWFGNDVNTHYTKMDLDDLKVFSHALNDTEALNLYNCGNETTCTSPPTNTCTYTSGNWNLNCADSCNISTAYNLSGSNLTFYNNGSVNLTATITLPTNSIASFAANASSCTVYLSTGGQFS